MANIAYIPQTPSHSSSYAQQYNPHTSSPLASSSVFNSNHSFAMAPPSSPVVQYHSRHQQQFKSRQCGPPHPPPSPAFPSASSSRPRTRSSRYMKPAPGSNLAPIPFALTPTRASSSSFIAGVESTQTTWMREKFKASCFERAKKAREQKTNKSRGAPSDPSSDGADIAMDEDDDDENEDGLADVIFDRIRKTEERRNAHAFARSFELEVGSSYDPAFEEYMENHGDKEEHPPEEFMHEDSEPNPDDYDFDPDHEDEYGDESWMDEYIASLPEEELRALSAAQGIGPATPTPFATQVQQSHHTCLPFSSQLTAAVHMDDVMMD